MSYHPIMGIIIFVVAMLISFYFGRLLLKNSQKNNKIDQKVELVDIKKAPVPKGEITSPDAPWLKDS